MSHTNDKTNTNEKPRKRDIFMHGVDRAASKLGLSSHSPAGHPHLQEAMTTTLPSSMSMMPTISQGYKAGHHPAPLVHEANYPNEIHWKAPPDPRTAGAKKTSADNRLGGSSKPKKDDKKTNDDDKKKQEEDKKKKRLEDNKTGSRTDRK